MVQLFLIGIAAGAASALLLASFFSGSPLAVLLATIAPLPILIAAIGWNHLAGLIAAVVAAAALVAAAAVLVVINGLLFVSFLVAVGLPAWWLGYLALLARPGAQPGELEWYPVGRLVVWAAVLGAAVVTVAILNFGMDAETNRAGLRRAFEHIIRVHQGMPADAPLQIPGVSDPHRFVDLLVLTVPPTAAVFSTITNLINLWLAARITKVSGRLQRPWPDLAAMRFPPVVAGGLAAVIAGSFLPGLVGIIAGVFAATLLMAFAVLGFAIVHKVTAGMNGRGFILAGVYAAVALIRWPVLVMVLLGLVDAVFDIRGYFANKRGPPAPST
jgi:hypothetical protein